MAGLFLASSPVSSICSSDIVPHHFNDKIAIAVGGIAAGLVLIGFAQRSHALATRLGVHAGRLKSRKALRTVKGRKESRKFAFEGFTLLAEARKNAGVFLKKSS